MPVAAPHRSGRSIFPPSERQSRNRRAGVSKWRVTVVDKVRWLRTELDGAVEGIDYIARKQDRAVADTVLPAADGALFACDARRTNSFGGVAVERTGAALHLASAALRPNQPRRVLSAQVPEIDSQFPFAIGFAQLLLLIGRADVRLAQASPFSPGPIYQVTSNWAIAAVVGLILLIVVIWLIPYLVDLTKAYGAAKAQRETILKELIGKVSADGLTVPELKEIAAVIQQGPSGVSGLARALMAFTVITVVGIALVLSLSSGAGDAAELRKLIITALLATFSTIVGFYFGGATSLEATTAAAAPPRPPGPRPLPGTVTLSPSGADFGSVPAGRSSEPRDFTLTNGSGATIGVTKVTLQGKEGFEVETVPPDQSRRWWTGETVELAPGEELAIRTKFRAPVQGLEGQSVEATLMVVHTAPGLAPTAALTARVVVSPLDSTPANA